MLQHLLYLVGDLRHGNCANVAKRDFWVDFQTLCVLWYVCLLSAPVVSHCGFNLPSDAECSIFHYVDDKCETTVPAREIAESLV